MPRPTNQQIIDKFNGSPEIDAGTEQAVATAQAQYPTGQVLEATKDEAGVCQVTVGIAGKDGVPARVLELSFDVNGTLTETDERTDKPAREHEAHTSTRAGDAKAKKGTKKK